MKIALTALVIILLVLLLLLYKTNKKWGLSLLFLCMIVLCFSLYEINNRKPLQIAATPEVMLEQTHSILDQNGQQLEVPIISQLPELPRGCEVTSLAMLLAHAGVIIDKMELAANIKKDDTPYENKNGNIYYGHPNNGFIGDMYDRNNPGLGVYHKPVYELAERYLPNRMLDLTGEEFFTIEKHLANGFPVWVIINTQYKRLPESAFVTWHTPEGVIDITYHEHAAVITGYDEQYVYVNDPLTVEKNKKIPKQAFIEAWVQMGRQAITYN